MTTPLRHNKRTRPEPRPDDATRARRLAPVKAPEMDGPAPDPGEPRLGVSQEPRPAVGNRRPLVAVCGLCGGAGASTLAYLIARFVAVGPSDDRRPVLALDAGGTTAGLSLYSDVASRRSLAELAEDIRMGRPTSESMFTTAADGLRIIATTPRAQPEPDLGMVSRILSDAREAHRMTVIDCGTPSLATERLALDLATHVVWVLPATEHGLRRARLSPWSAFGPDVVQVLVARHDPPARRASTRELAALADARESTLILMPHVEDLDANSFDGALEVCGVTLEALGTQLRQ